MPAEDDVGRLRWAIEAIWNRGELDEADRLFAAGYVNHGGLIPDLVRGPEAIKLAAALYRLAFPRLHVTVEDVLADGATVALRWTARGGGEALAGTTFGRVAGGKVAESWTYWEARRPSTAAPGRAGGGR